MGLLVLKSSVYKPFLSTLTRPSKALTLQSLSPLFSWADAMASDMSTLNSLFASQRIFDASINLNPTISVAYTGLSNTAGTLTYTLSTGAINNTDTLTDVNGSTCVIVSHTSQLLHISTIVLAMGHTVFGGTFSNTNGATGVCGITTFNPYTVAETVTDAHGSTGVVATVSGTSLTFTSIVMAAGRTTLAGTLTGGTSGATSTAGAYSWGDQQITLSQGSSFAEVDYLFTGITSTTARDMEIWSAAGRTGTQYLESNNGVTDALSLISASSQNINTSNMLVPVNPNLNVPNTLYITFSTVNGSALTGRLIINGEVLN